MVTVEEVAALAAALPEVEEGERHGRRAWSVRRKVFAWERPFTKADLKRFGAVPAPTGPILALATEDLGEKEAVLAAGEPAFFDMAHFEGYPAYLVKLDAVAPEALADALEDAWAAKAPGELVERRLRER
ncbi:hypothetical protein EV189_3896 [Motilibacter rhizosphaerae]|uniref:YjbR protein n=1 Tax=Motilibacter rhizosphaerae TaxID=598652 RepID=A0A4Q7NA37_9ACTN|nr:hypothetical protein [Motilibacter rhizosphaerae]RZS79026.1 hypothetical protein EV189_3896 [Motilibacter rhizosphaerae]